MRFCVYHGYEWDCLADQGWITHTVETLSDGTRLACMVWKTWGGGMKNPFPMSNYPPGVSDSTYGAPWNEVDLIATCYVCGDERKAEDLAHEELQSYEDNDDGTFMCDSCHERNERHIELNTELAIDEIRNTPNMELDE